MSETKQIEPERLTVTAQITEIDETFLGEVVKNRDVMSKSEAVRKGLELLRRTLGYSQKSGRKEVVS